MRPVATAPARRTRSSARKATASTPGRLNVVVPDGFNVAFDGGTDLSLSGDAKGLQTFTSGTVSAPYNFWTCLEATDASNLTSASLTSGNQNFNIQAWPEDAAWASTVGGDVQGDVPKLEDLTGLPMPGGTIDITEAGNSQLGDYSGSYSPATRTATVTEDTDNATVSHELSHIWFNSTLFTATWMDEGFAGYSEKVAGTGNYKPCADPGAYPGTGSPDLTTWKVPGHQLHDGRRERGRLAVRRLVLPGDRGGRRDRADQLPDGSRGRLRAARSPTSGARRPRSRPWAGRPSPPGPCST